MSFYCNSFTKWRRGDSNCANDGTACTAVDEVDATQPLSAFLGRASFHAIARRPARSGQIVDTLRVCGVLLVALLLTGCDWQRFAPGDKCWWQRSNPAVVTDTVWNQTPDSGNPAWRPFLLVSRQVWADSTRVCR